MGSTRPILVQAFSFLYACIIIADLTARARLRDAAIALIAAGGKPTTRSVAARANVSIGLIRHHFGTMNGLLLARDEHVATLIRNAKNDAIHGPMPNVLETLREAGQDSILGYLIHRLTDSNTAIDALVDQLADGAADYIRRAIDAGLLTPIPDVPTAARILTIYSLGSLVLGRHLKRLLDVDITAEDIAAEPRVTDYVQVQLTLFANLFTPHLLEQLRPQLEEKTEEEEKTEGKEEEE